MKYTKYDELFSKKEFVKQQDDEMLPMAADWRTAAGQLPPLCLSVYTRGMA